MSSSRYNERLSYRRSRSRSPSLERKPKSRDPNILPESFERIPNLEVDSELSALQRMKSSYVGGPLHTLHKYIQSDTRIKVWTRSHNSVRGIFSGYLIAFDKHWNLIMKDCLDVFLKPKKSKTPFLRSVGPNEVLPDMPAKKPRKKKNADKAEAVKGSGESTTAGPSKVKAEKSGTVSDSEKKVKKAKKAEAVKGSGENAAAGSSKPEAEKSGTAAPDLEKKAKKAKKAKTTLVKKTIKQAFVRGDSIVMIAPEADGSAGTEESDDEVN